MASAMTLTLRNELSEIRRLADALEAFAEESAIPPTAATRIMLVLDELLTNTISYGYPQDRKGEILVEATCLGDQVEVAVSDDAVPFDPVRSEAPALEATLDERPVGGLGLHLINSMADVRYRREGDRNVVRLTLPLSREP